MCVCVCVCVALRGETCLEVRFEDFFRRARGRSYIFHVEGPRTESTQEPRVEVCCTYSLAGSVTDSVVRVLFSLECNRLCGARAL